MGIGLTFRSFQSSPLSAGLFTASPSISKTPGHDGRNNCCALVVPQPPMARTATRTKIVIRFISCLSFRTAFSCGPSQEPPAFHSDRAEEDHPPRPVTLDRGLCPSIELASFMHSSFSCGGDGSPPLLHAIERPGDNAPFAFADSISSSSALSLTRRLCMRNDEHDEWDGIPPYSNSCFNWFPSEPLLPRCARAHA